MKKRFGLIACIFAAIALFIAVFATKDKIAQAANKIYLNATDITLELGHYKTLKVYGTNEKATFKSANTRAATVTSGGKVTAQGWGSTTIYTYVAGKTLKTKVTIVQMSKKNVTLAPGNTIKLELWGSDSSTTWSSDNTKVATVSDDGLVTGVGVGKATVTATFNGKKITSQITVIGLNHTYKVLEFGGKFSLTRSNYGSTIKLQVTGSNEKVTWSSSDTKVAVVDSKGKVTAKGPGEARIYASVNGSSVYAVIRVLKMEHSTLELKKGETFKLNVLGTDSEIIWKSNKKSVATVDDNGVVTAVKQGTAKIIAEVDGRLVRCIVTVK